MKIYFCKHKFWRTLFSLTSILLFMLSLVACHGGGDGVSVTVSPENAAVITGLSIPLTVTVSGTANTSVIWSVNGISGGNATVGTVDESGIYTAPAVRPTPATVTVTATSVDDSGISDSATITISSLALAGINGGYFGEFNSVATMKTARSNHTATLLSSGQVLVTGGIGSAGAAIAEAELYRPGFNNFSTASAMSTPRVYHTATMLQNGKVLITGGVDDNNTVLAQAELYDPETGTFTATGSMTAPRAYHSATLLLNGKVLIAGGNETSDLAAGTPTAGIELFDPATGTFISDATTVMSDARYYHTATLLRSGKVLLIGGIGAGGIKHSSAEIYDPGASAGSNISATGPLATGRWLHTAALMADGKVLIAGGSSGTIAGGLPSSSYLAAAEIYDPATGTFNSAPGQLIDTRAFFTTTLLADRTLLSAGGFGLMSTDPVQIGSTLATAELFTSTGGGASYTGNMPLQRANHTAILLPSSGKVLLIGGNGYSGGSFNIMNSALLYQ